MDVDRILKLLDHGMVAICLLAAFLLIGALLLTDREVPQQLWDALIGFALVFGAFKGANGAAMRKMNGKGKGE